MSDLAAVKLGTILQQARAERHLALADIAAALKIKEHYLAALEAGDYAALPPGAHAKGFLRSYAQYIGLGERLPELQELYRRETTDEPPSLSIPQPLPEGKVPSARVILSALIAAVLLYTIWYSLNDTPPQTITVPPAPVADLTPPPAPEPVPEPAALPPLATAVPVAPAAEPIEPAPVEPQPAPVEVKPAEAAPTPKQPQKLIRAIAASWIEVRDASGAVLYAKLLNAGQEYPVPNQPGLRLMAGNAGGIVIVDDGKAGKPLGRPSQVVRNVPLTAGKAPAAKPAAKPPTKPAAKPVPYDPSFER